jgi:6-pyruvoyl-tetrahydropterin synthase
MRIKVKEIFRGVHSWPDAGGTIETEKVDFLANTHAHDFRITVECNVEHEDREIEFYLLRNDLVEIIVKNFECKNGFFQFEGNSCEAIGNLVIDKMRQLHGSKGWMVEVAENEFQSAIIYDVKKEKEPEMDIDKAVYDGVLKKARSIFVERQAKYGNSVNEIDLHTIVGLMRMKLYRIYNEGASPKSEDELLDCINYAVFALSRVSKDD